MIARGTGWLPDPPDARDHLLGLPRATERAQEVKLEGLVRLVRDQGPTSSCVGNAVCAMAELRRALDRRAYVPLSELALYELARRIDGLHLQDGGAYIRSAMRVLHRLGVPPRELWPWDPERVNQRPPTEAEVAALRFADGRYERIDALGAARAERVLDALQARCPVVLGTQITDAFVDGSSDTIAAPRAAEVRRGGHAIGLVGFDRGGERARALNSWGTEWAQGGFAWLAAEWLADWSTRDVWVMLPGGANA